MGFRTPCIHRQTHTRARASWQITGMKVYLGIQVFTPSPPPPTNSKSCPTSILPSASETPGPLPLKQQSGSVYAIILTSQFVTGCSRF